MTFNCEQIAGFGNLDFFLLSETSNWPLVLNDQTSAQLIFTPEINNVEGTIDADSINVDVVPKETADGIMYTNFISFKFITRSESLEQLLEQYQNKPGCCIGDLNTGFRKIFGTNEEPLFLTYRVDDGQKPEDNAGITVTIKGETRKRPAYYTV
jgi:hypothetical protein